MSLKPTFAKNVKRFRAARGLTQAELSSQLGVTLQTVFSYESGAQWPRDEVLDALAKALNVRPWQLIADETEGGTIPPELVEHVAAAAKACGLKVSR
jgi:transcriptional regulator with XRE-family HTH domain